MSEPKQPMAEALEGHFPEALSEPMGDTMADSMAEAPTEELEERHRAKTMSRKEMARDLRRQKLSGGADAEELALMREIDRLRPKTRADCVNGPRPCLFVSCKHHLFLDVNPGTGSVKLNFPDKEIWELKYTCALDVADQGGITLEDVGQIMNLTRERIRQVEARGLTKLRVAAEGDGDSLGQLEDD